MAYPEQYRAELLNTLKNIDLQAVEEVVEVLRDARAHNRCIFVCGSGSGAIAASRLLCDSIRASGLNQPSRQGIYPLSDELPAFGAMPDDLSQHCVLLDQLRAVATSGDVVVGISASGYTPSLMRAFEFATETGCRTICICGPVGGILETMSDVAVLVPASKIGSVEDAQMIVCRLIGHLFSDSQARS